MPIRKLSHIGFLTIFLCLGINSSSVNAQDTLRISLKESIEAAVKRSPEIEVEQSKVYASESLYSFAKANRYLSKVDLSTVHSVAPGLTDSDFSQNDWYLDPELRYDWGDFSPFNRVQLDIAQPLYTWGQLDGSIDAAKSGIGIAEADSDSKRAEVVERIASNYLDLLLAVELKRLSDETGQALQQAEGAMQNLLDEGEEDLDDADLFQVQLVKQEYLAQKIEVEESLTLASSALKKQLFINEDVFLLPESESMQAFNYVLEGLADYQAIAQGLRPEIKKAEAGLAARRNLVKVAKSDYYPKLYLAASARAGYAPGHYKQRNPFISDPFIGSGFEAGLGLRMNLNFSQTKAKVAQAKADEMEVQALERGARQLIDFEVENAYRQMVIKAAAMESNKESVRISGEWLRSEQINFDLEIGNTKNLVLATQSNLKMRANYLTKVREYNGAVLGLLKAVGSLENEIRGLED